MVEFSYGLQFVDIMHVRWQPLATAALGNAAVILGISAAIESLYWIWRELSLNGAVLDWAPGPPRPNSSQPGPSVIRVAHLSDLHIVGERYGYRMEAGTNGPRGNRVIRSALRRLGEIHASAPLDRVVMTGDITDAGTRAEWAEFLDLLRGCPELRRRICCWSRETTMSTSSIAPIRAASICRGAPASRCASSASCWRSTRWPANACMSSIGVRGLGPSLRDFLRQGQRAELLRELAGRGTMRGRREMTKVWEAIFPLVEPPAPGESLTG